MKVILFFGDARLERDWDQANLDALLVKRGVKLYQPLSGEDVVRAGWNQPTTGDATLLGPRWARWLRRHILRTLIYVSWERRGSVTLKTKLARRRAIRLRLEIGLCRLVDRVLCDGERLARFIEGLIPVAKSATKLMQDMTPGLVVVATDIYRGQEVELVKAAKAAGIQTLGVVASWDTLTSKGSYLVPPDHLAVWGDASAGHAIERHGYTIGRVHVVGALRMDTWKVSKVPGLASGKLPVVMVVGTSVAYIHNEHEVVTRLAKLGQKHGFSVWYRPHPRRLTRLEGDLGTLTAKWNAQGVFFDRGACVEEPVGFLPTVLSHVRVVVTAFSTLVIEAALHGTPSLLIGFGPSSGGAEGEHVAEVGTLIQHAEFEHMAEVTRWPGVTVCKTMNELESQVMSHASSPRHSLHHANVLRWHAMDVVQADGQTTARMVQLVNDLVKGREPWKR